MLSPETFQPSHSVLHVFLSLDLMGVLALEEALGLMGAFLVILVDALDFVAEGAAFFVLVLEDFFFSGEVATKPYRSIGLFFAVRLCCLRAGVARAAFLVVDDFFAGDDFFPGEEVFAGDDFFSADAMM